MDLRVLGPLEAVADGEPVALGGPKQRLVLAVLVVADGHPLSVDTLVDRVWGDDPPGDAPSSVHTYVSRLRSVFGDRLERSGVGYALRLESDEVDAHRFEKLVVQGRSALSDDPQAAGRFLREGLALWRGRPFGDLADEPALRPEVTRLEELRVQAVEDRVEADLAVGHHAELVPELEVLTIEYPLRERFRSQQMLALYRSGRQAEALRVYQDTRTMLVEELGIDPSPDLQALENRILNQDPALAIDLRPHVECVALLFTDLEDSTVLWELHPEAMQPALGQHDRLLDDAVTGQEGRVFKRTGDGICAAFEDVGSAVAAAERIQHSLVTADWPDTPALKTRIAIDVGEVEARGGDYYGPTLNRCARIMASGHGRQILLSEQSVEALKETPAGWQVKALGEYRFRGLGRPQAVYQLVVEGLPAEFPTLRIDRLPPPLPGSAFGRTVRGYELREQIGAGDFGVVYRAYQPTVGREVAVKVIRPEYVDQPAFVRRFETEAQLVAQLEHPHIVALYDYWRDPDGAYLVFRWLRGGSLRQALDRGPFHMNAAMRLLNQVGEALAHAHRQGVAHRDLKPSNVLLDEDDNAYLTDFGIAARLVDASETGRPYATSPAYVPPEELRSEPLTAAADIYGLGLLTFEVLTGRPPPMDEPLPAPSGVRAEVPAALDAVIVKATADLPADRFPTVDQFLDAVREALGEPVPVEETVFTPARNPYKGLRAFGETDSADFFGRDRTIADLLQALGEHRLVAVVGPSGSGKSSVVKAGLVPALRAGGLPGSREWLVTTMFPGSHPFEELEAALLRIAADKPSGLDEILASDRRGLVRATKQMFPDESTVVVVVDQFEELFTLTGDEETRRRFLDALVEVASDQRSRLKIVVTLRADFFDRPLQYPEFADLLRAGLVTITAQSDDELARAIAGPAVGVGVRLEAGLVDHIISDVHDQPGALPLLQYALTELFAARHTDLLTIAGYQTTGGVTGALGKHAEDLYQNLDETARTAIRQVFLRLVTVAEGREDTRRRVRRTELEGLTVDRAALNHVLKTYGEHRLLTFDRDPVTRGPTVEVAHEALLAEWDRLAGWIDERRETLLLHQRFAAGLSEWEAAGQDPGYLLSGGRLVQFETWADGTDLTLTSDERQFLDHSRQKEDADRAKRRRRRQWIMGGFALAALVATLLAIWALLAQRDAEESARQAEENAVLAEERRQEAVTERENAEATSRRSLALALANAAIVNLGIDQERATLLAVEAVVTTRVDGLVLRQAEEALHRALQSLRLEDTLEGGSDLAVAGGGSLAIAGDDGVTLWDIETGEPQSTSPATYMHATSDGSEEVPLGRATVVDVAPDGQQLAIGTAGGTVIVWDLGSDGTSSLQVPEEGQGRQIQDIRYSPDGSSLLWGDAGGFWTGWDTADSVVSKSGRVDVGVVDLDVRVAFNRDGSKAAIAGEASVLWDIETGEVTELTPGSTITALAFGPDGSTLLTLDRDGRAAWWNVETGAEEEASLDLGAVSPTALAIDSTGSLTAVGFANGRIGVLAGSDGNLANLYDLWGHEQAVTGLSFAPDGGRLLSISQDGTRTWNVTAGGAREWFTLKGAAPLGADLAFSPDGTLLAVAHDEAVIGMYDAYTGHELGSMQASTLYFGFAASLDFLSDGDHLVASFVDPRLYPVGFMRTFDVDAHAEDLNLPGLWQVGMDVNADGTLAASAGPGGVSIFDLGTGEAVGAVLGTGEGKGRLVAFSPDGSMLAFQDSSGRIDVVEFATRTHLTSFDHPMPAELGLGSIEFNPDGSLLLTAGADGVVRVWNPMTGGETTSLMGHLGPVNAAHFSPDGGTIATGGADGTVRLWDPSSRAEVLILQESGPPIGSLAFSGDGARLAVLDADRTIRMYALDLDDLLMLASDRLTRSLTQEECLIFLQHETCPEGDQ